MPQVQPAPSSVHSRDGEDAALFEAPDELICPITHTLFRSPVVTAAGTVYEESAIAQHLASSSKDPLTNQDITDHKLVPVFLLRSRAEQYAVGTASACVARALQPDCNDPARYLRRACEICDEAGVVESVPELPAKVVMFALQHRGSVHDVFILLHFATCLATSGQRSRALVLFATLLRLERERPVQIAIIKRCLLHCWCVAGAGSALALADEHFGVFESSALARKAARFSGELSTEPQALATRGSGAPVRSAGQFGSTSCRSSFWDVNAVADFIAVQQGLSAVAFLHILRALGVPGPELIRLCSNLLSRATDEASTSTETRAAAGAAVSAAAALGVVPFMVDAVADGLRQELKAAVASCGASAEASQGRPVALDKASRSCIAEDGHRKRRGLGRSCAVGGALLGVILPQPAGRLASAGPLLWLLAQPRHR